MFGAVHTGLTLDEFAEKADKARISGATRIKAIQLRMAQQKGVPVEGDPYRYTLLTDDDVDQFQVLNAALGKAEKEKDSAFGKDASESAHKAWKQAVANMKALLEGKATE